MVAPVSSRQSILIINKVKNKLRIKLKSFTHFGCVIFCYFCLGLTVTSCADTDDIAKETKTWSVEKLYGEANLALQDKAYSRAIKLYKALESSYPYGIYAQQGLLDLTYAYYQDNKPELALPTVDQFIITYPTSNNMDYALYLKGYINYKNDNGLLSNITKQDLSERDPKSLLEAYNAFHELVIKYPHSKFASDARFKANNLINALARGELYRSRYYMNIKAYVAGINHADNIIVNYPNTIYVEEALAIQVYAYQCLGQHKLSTQVARVLKLNFPNSAYNKAKWEYQDMPWYTFWR